MLFPLDSLRDFIAYDPWHFWGMANTATLPIRDPACNTVVFERAYQGADRAGRHEMRRAIADAQNKLASALRYAVMPTQYDHYDVPVQPSRAGGAYPLAAGWSAWATGAPAGRPYVVLGAGYVRGLGVETLTTIGTPAVVYTDRDGDGLNDTFTVTLTTTAQPDTVRLYPPEADRLAPGPLQDSEQIAPVTATSDGTTLTVTGPAWLMVRPTLYVSYPTVPYFDPIAAPAIFMQTVQVVAVSIDDSAAVTITGVNGWPCCQDSPIGTVIGATVLDAQSGVVGLDLPCSCASPTRVRVQYVAGLPLSGGQVVEPWRTVLAKLAIAEMARPICACEAAQAIVSEYAVDLALIDGRITKYQLPPAEVYNPFGTRRGHIEAWRAVRRLYHARGFLP